MFPFLKGIDWFVLEVTNWKYHFWKKTEFKKDEWIFELQSAVSLGIEVGWARPLKMFTFQADLNF